MSDRFDRYVTHINLAQNDWRINVGNPYIIAYTGAYTAFKDTLDKQKDTDKKAGELFVTAACVATGSVLLASVGSITLRMLARRTVVQIASRSLGRTFANLFRVVRKNEGVAFAVGEFVDKAKGDLKDKAEKIAANYLQSVSNVITPEPLVQFLQMDSIMRANVNCAIRMGQAIEASSLNEHEKTAAYAPLMAAPLANSPVTRGLQSGATLSELIELSFYLSMALESDSLVSWPESYAGAGEGGMIDNARRATSTPITARPTDTATYPRPAVPRTSLSGFIPAHQSVAVSRAGSDVQSKTNALCVKAFGKPLYGSTFFGLGGPADTQKSVELRQADIWLDQLANTLKPRNPLDALR